MCPLLQKVQPMLELLKSYMKNVKGDIASSLKHLLKSYMKGDGLPFASISLEFTRLFSIFLEEEFPELTPNGPLS